MGEAVFGVPEWRARSGRTVKARPDGSVLFEHANGYLSPESVMDAEEFFQAARDAELDRWRDRHNPTYVVYETNDPDTVHVLDEADGSVWVYSRATIGRFAETTSVRVARGYFDTRPVRPWHDAAEGEFWSVEHMGMVEVCQVRKGRFEGVDATLGSRVSMPVTHSSIVRAVQLVVAS